MAAKKAAALESVDSDAPPKIDALALAVASRGALCRPGAALSRSWPALGPLLDRSWGTKNALKVYFAQTMGPVSLQACEHLSLQVASVGAAKRKQFDCKLSDSNIVS